MVQRGCHGGPRGRERGAMACACFSLWLLLLLVAAPWQGQGRSHGLNFTRQDFPRDFVFGAGTSAYQYEGATDEDGRSPSIWDTFTHAASQTKCALKYKGTDSCVLMGISTESLYLQWLNMTGRMPDKSTGDLAADGYHKYKEDVQLMSDTGLEAYRFSISWSRLIPNGRGAVNPKGLEYYNNLINELVKRGIQIHVTLYHLDFPQILEDEYHGWLSPRVVEDFTAYANVCFREFGDRVSHWTTMDEPNVIAIAAYDSGIFPPCRCSLPFGLNCVAGNSTTEPYIVTHNSILAHASVVKLYRERYQATQKGEVGMNIYSFWTYPFSDAAADIAATQRSMDFMFGWIINPLVYGDYPEVMKKIAGSRIPSFSKEQSDLVHGAIDFIGINHYTSVYVSDRSNGATMELRDYNADVSATFRFSRTDPPSGQFVPYNLPRDPLGLQCMLAYIRDTYQNIPVYVQENGYGQLTADATIHDVERVDYLSSYIGNVLPALRNGANMKGYFVWSFLDVFKLLAGYNSRYGLHYVDFQDPELRRQPKFSAHWYSKFLRNEIGVNIESISSEASSRAQQ